MKNEQKKLRKLAIKKLMADGCPEDLARLMPKPSNADAYCEYHFITFASWFCWGATEQGVSFWNAIADKMYTKARKILIENGLKPWSKKAKSARTEFEMMTDEQRKRTVICALFRNENCLMTLINHVKRVPVAINKESKNG